MRVLYVHWIDSDKMEVPLSFHSNQKVKCENQKKYIKHKKRTKTFRKAVKNHSI